MTGWQLPPVPPEQRTKTKLRVWGFIENLGLYDVSSFDLGQNFRIRRTTEAERQHPFVVDGKSYEERDPRWPREDNPGTIIETIVHAELSSRELQNLSSLLYWTSSFTKEVTDFTLHYISRALLLFLDGITKLRRAAPELGDLPIIEESRRRPNFSTQPGWVPTLSSKYRMVVWMSANDLEGFKKFFWGYNTIRNDPEFLSNAIGRFGQASKIAGEVVNIEARFLHYMRSLEALLGGGPEITRKLALRTAALVGGSSDNRQDAYDFIIGAYKARSDSVHGGSLGSVKVRREALSKSSPTGLGILEEVNLLHWYCRLSIRRIVDLILGVTGREPMASTWKAMGESNRKDWVVGLLDYAIIRDDLAKSLEEFYTGAVDIAQLCETYNYARQRPFGGLSNIYDLP